MKNPTKISGLDLNPIPNKTYWNCDREWREEFIYFLMVDRFHDNHNRTPVQSTARSRSSGTIQQLEKFCGGTIKGILNHLDYIKNLGCTALWLSPVFENNDAPDPNSDKYHGYSIQNYLDIDPRFGTKQDLIDLVDASHECGMRVFLDVVINHSGDNWYYPDGYRYKYFNNTQFPLGGWRQPDRPIPEERRNPNYYHRRGAVQDWNDPLQNLYGDFLSLKSFNNDEDEHGRELQEILIKSHCYWIREADIDGFRIDAAKLVSPLAVARFCSGIREYAYRLGKRWFFLFGELIAADDVINRYTGPNTPSGDKTIYFGLTSVLDFPLYYILAETIKGLRSPEDLINRYEQLRNHALSRGELGRYLVTFLDNHDQIGQKDQFGRKYKRRFAADAPDEQVIAGIGYLLCALGTPCIYYGTEQGFSGKGEEDEFVREAMFNLDNPQINYLNPTCRIYQEIAKIAQIFKENEPLRFGRMYFREISGNGRDFGLPQGHPCILAFSRILAFKEILVAYNTSPQEHRSDFVIVDNGIQKDGGTMKFLYGKQGTVPVQIHPDPGNKSLFVKLELEPMQFVILQG